MTLTKKYRLVWGNDKQLISDPFQEYIGSETIVGAGLNSYESDTLQDIENKIIEENLIYETEIINSQNT